MFARSPSPGRVKTRLIPALGAREACRLHCQLVEHNLKIAAASGLATDLWLDGEAGEPLVQQWRRTFALQIYQQRGADLGARMDHAVAHTLRCAQGVILLGSDCLTITARDLRAAKELLRYRDAVVAPAHDGGYVLLGLTQHYRSLFARSPWGTRHVMPLLRRRLRAAGIDFAELGWQHDVDRPADLARCYRRLRPAGKAGKKLRA